MSNIQPSDFQPIIAVNGKLGAGISPLDRGFTYGDGLFETMRLSAGSIPLWERHYQRLSEGCKRLQIHLNSPELLEQKSLVLEAAVARGIASGVVKIIVTRGLGGRGYGFEQNTVPTLCIGVYPGASCPPEYYQAGVNLHLCQQRLGSNAKLAGIKHLNKLEHILARTEWQGSDYAEGLLRDNDGSVIEGTVSNIFAVARGQVLTPALDQCGVKGVMRNLIITELAPQLGFSVAECKLSLEQVLDSDELFLTNSVFGIWPVKAIGRRELQRGPVTADLQRSLDKYIGSVGS